MSRMFPCFIAYRYLFSKKSFNSINLITIVSVASIAVATMAIVIILSVFNGFQELAEKNSRLLGAPLRIIPPQGRYMDYDSIKHVLGEYDEIEDIVEILETKVYVNTHERQKACEIIGLSTNFRNLPVFDTSVIDGARFFGDTLGAEWMVVSVGVAIDMSSRPGSGVPLHLTIPKKEGRINPGSLIPFYRTDSAYVAGVFRSDDPQIDADRIIADIGFVRSLSGVGETMVSALNLYTKPTVSPLQLKEKLKNIGVESLTAREQNADAFHMIAIEKWLSFALLTFILIIASFNIISTISILISEKESNMNILRAMGASNKTIKAIFMDEGLMISLAGGIAGGVIGILLSLGQQCFGWIKLSADIDPSMLAITSYPVVVKFTDVLIIMSLLFIISLITTFIAVFSRRINKSNVTLV